MSDYINIGRIVAAFGLTGQLVLKHSLGKKTTFKNVDAIFIEEGKGRQLPYFVQSSKAKNHEETFIHLEGMDTREKALKLVQKQAYLLAEDFRKLVAKDSPLALLGYALFNKGELIGAIDEIIEQPHQVLLQVDISDRKALIPLHNETLDNINHKKKEVHVILPDGLLEVYLQ